jgi:hypothetical protein
MYMDFEREERWLNEMAAAGWNLTRYTWCRYVFAEGAPGTYQYRIQLLPDSVSATESRQYLGFLEDAGVEMVATYQRWVYLRKPADSEPFDLFSDRESRVAHHKRVATLFGVIVAAQLPLLAVNLVNVTAQVQDNAYFSLPIVLLYVVLLGMIGLVALRQLAAVRRLERDALVHE